MRRNTYRVVWIALISYWLILFAATHLPPLRFRGAGGNDKVAHFIAYAMLTALLSGALSLSRRGRSGIEIALKVLVIVLAYGAVDEWTQALIGRSCELLDWLADAAGALVALGVFFLLRQLFTRRAPVPETAGTR